MVKFKRPVRIFRYTGSDRYYMNRNDTGGTTIEDSDEQSPDQIWLLKEISSDSNSIVNSDVGSKFYAVKYEGEGNQFTTKEYKTSDTKQLFVVEKDSSNNYSFRVQTTTNQYLYVEADAPGKKVIARESTTKLFVWSLEDVRL